MNTRTVGLIAASALIPAILSLFFSTLVFVACWLVLLALWTWLLLPTESRWPSALVGGLAAGLVTGGLQAAFLSTYAANHPADMEALAWLTDLGKRGYLLGFALVAGLAWGALAGALAAGVARWRRGG